MEVLDVKKPGRAGGPLGHTRKLVCAPSRTKLSRTCTDAGRGKVSHFDELSKHVTGTVTGFQRTETKIEAE
ncbi:hypothetical protein ZHAS_00019926 [Anopheles sinensis]|uniref:Uncharacterized protein n=1 Tax=Anopheles sinensis TaxID=74873 RepID=A0A084WMK1_ANOSI|nr:hypothetical protein ZHAS_00019926 [Anopheles sinensis]